MDEKRIALALVPEDQLLPIIKVVNRWTLKMLLIFNDHFKWRQHDFLIRKSIQFKFDN
jgi:hypothetical protein